MRFRCGWDAVGCVWGCLDWCLDAFECVWVSFRVRLVGRLVRVWSALGGVYVRLGCVWDAFAVRLVERITNL